MSDLLLISSQPLDILSAYAHVVQPDCGAVASFIGTTRDNFNHKEVLCLEYEAYEPMALKEMEKICVFLHAEYSVTRVSMSHRVGRVNVSEPSVVIFVSSSHRQQALEAVSKAIDMVKETVPIWKKEWYKDGSVWKGSAQCCQKKS